MDVGTKEVSGPMTENDYLHTNEVLAKAVQKKVQHAAYEVIPGAVHHETEWAKRMPDILRFLFSILKKQADKIRDSDFVSLLLFIPDYFTSSSICSFT